MKKIRKIVVSCLPLFIFGLFLVTILLPFYKNNGIISGGEGSYYLDFSSLFNNYGFTWNNYGTGVFAFSLNFAYVFHLIFLQNLFHNEKIINFLEIFSIYFLPFLAVYLLSLELRVKPVLGFLLAIFYIANPFSVNFLKSINQWNMLAAYILPSFFLIILKFYNEEKKLFLIFGFNSLLFAFTNANPPTMAIYQIAVILFIILVALHKKEKKVSEVIRKYLIVISSFFLFNFWWIITWFYAFSIIKDSYSKEFAISILRGTLKFKPALWQTFNLVNLLGFPVEKNYDYTIAYFGRWWSPFLLAIPTVILIYSLLKENLKVFTKDKLLLLKESFHLGIDFVFSSKQIKPHKLQVVLLLMLLIVGYLSKGVQGVFGDFYEYMVYHLPLFSIFKSAAEKWGILFVFLLTLYLIFLFKDFKRNQFYNSVLALFIIYIIYISVPFLRLQFIPDYTFDDKIVGSRKFVDKKDYQDLRKKLNADPLEYRVLSLPGSLNYQIALKIKDNRYYTGNDPILNNTTKAFIAPYNGNFNQRFPLLFDSISDPKYFKLLGLYNIRKIVLNRDEYPWFGFKEKESTLEKQTIFDANLESEKGKAIDLYDVTDKYYLPRFYIPDQIVYSPISYHTNLLDVISSIENLSQRSAFFIDYRALGGPVIENHVLRSAASDEILTGEMQSLVDETKLQEGTQNFNQDTILFPYARWKPGSFMYPAVLQKEEKLKKQDADNPEASFNQHLFFAAKRMYEIQKWEEGLSKDNFNGTLKRFETEMEDSLEDFNKFAKQNSDIYSLILRLEVSFGAYKTRLFNVLAGSNRADKAERKKFAKEIFDDIHLKIKSILVKHYTPTKYKFIIQEDGIYEILAENNDISDEWKITNATYDESKKYVINMLGQIGEERWISYGQKEFKKGTEILYFDKPPSSNLLDGKWTTLEKDIDFGIVGKVPSKLAFPTVFQESKKWEPDTDYHFSIKYKSNCQIRVLFLEENKEVTDPTIFKKVDKYHSLLDRPFAVDKDWTSLDFFLRSGRYVKSAKVFIFQDATQKCSNGTIDYKDGKIEKVFDPKIILKKVGLTPHLHNPPEITFQKINPTKYSVNVKGAKDPYLLVFGDTFDSSWKAYITKSNKGGKDILASYFAGAIKEAKPLNKFFDRDIFETIGKTFIPEDRHILINGFANSWYITPNDYPGQENYQIIVEYWPQRLFYIGSFITIVSLLLIIIKFLSKLKTNL